MTQISLTLPQKVAQLFLLGSDTPSLEEALEPFYATGLGGLILFRHHLQPYSTAPELKDALDQYRQHFHGAGLSFIGLDQEGGNVERLPFWLCPTGLFPWVLGHKADLHFTEQVNRETARRLRWLGFNLNFTPTVDLNRERLNPIIGVRAYGCEPQPVTQMAHVVMQSHWEAGVLPVAKHFPGHGAGTVDSHLSLPLFEAWAEDELKPYESLIRHGLPAILVAHGLYPKLAKSLGADPKIPASLSAPFIETLLRQKMGFQGLVFSDDLMMGAVWGDTDPVEVALNALIAGVDVLVYRRAQPEALMAYHAVLNRVQSGKLSESLIDNKVSRILAMHTQLKQVDPYPYPPISVSAEACEALALNWAQQGLLEYHHDFISPLPFSRVTRWLLTAPDRETMKHYQPDGAHDKGLLHWCEAYGIAPTASYVYPIDETFPTLPDGFMSAEAIDNIVFIAFNSVFSTQQQQVYEALKTRYPGAKMILVSLGMPTDAEVLSRPWIHLQLPSFRPAAMQALMQWLTQPPRSLV